MDRTLLLPFFLLSRPLSAMVRAHQRNPLCDDAMPGLTQFTCNTIDRTSTDIENYPNNSYVNTGLSATFEKGMTYDVF